jgi:hypothetical protein
MSVPLISARGAPRGEMGVLVHYIFALDRGAWGVSADETRTATGVGKPAAAPPPLARTTIHEAGGRTEDAQDPLITGIVEMACILDLSLQAKFYGQPVSPTILLPSQFPNFCIEVAVAIGFKNSTRCLPQPSHQPDRYGRIRKNVLNPIRLISVLGKYVDAAFAFHKPDLDFAWKSCLATSRCQVKELFGGMVAHLK